MTTAGGKLVYDRFSNWLIYKGVLLGCKIGTIVACDHGHSIRNIAIILQLYESIHMSKGIRGKKCNHRGNLTRVEKLLKFIGKNVV